jgi:hypothetical protein
MLKKLAILPLAMKPTMYACQAIIGEEGLHKDGSCLRFVATLEIIKKSK